MEENWLSFKSFILQTIHSQISQKSVKQQKNLPWHTQDIKQDMSHRKRLYKRAKQTNFPSHWDAYRKFRNLINKKLGKAHTDYHNRLFDDYLLETGDNFGNIIDQDIKKNVAYPPCPRVEFNKTVQRKS